jgi:hypothetical protein
LRRPVHSTRLDRPPRTSLSTKRPTVLGPVKPARPRGRWCRRRRACEFDSVRNVEHRTPAVYVDRCHGECLMWCVRPAALDSFKLRAAVDWNIDQPKCRFLPLGQPLQRGPFLPRPASEVQHHIGVQSEKLRERVFIQPSSTSRLPSASGSPNNGIIHSSGLRRSAWCSLSSFLATVACQIQEGPRARSSSPRTDFDPIGRSGRNRTAYGREGHMAAADRPRRP